MHRQPFTDASGMPQARHDLLGPIHKTLRLLMGDTLARLGSMDVDDDRSTTDTLSQLDALISVSRLHLTHENVHLHPALEAARPGTCRQAVEEHRDHRATLEKLAGDLRALRSAAATDRDRLARRLYRELACFVADSLAHMDHEESAHTAVLWAHYRDEQLRHLEAAIVADTEPAAMTLVLRWMIPALNPKERVALLSELRAVVPDAEFRQVLDLARAVLPLNAWAALAHRLGVPPQPGLVTTRPAPRSLT